MQIRPSAMWQQRRQVCGFLFADCDASDCFYDGLMPKFSLQIAIFKLHKKVFGIVVASWPS